MEGNVNMYVLLFTCPDYRSAEIESILESKDWCIGSVSEFNKYNEQKSSITYRIYYKYYTDYSAAIIDFARIRYNNPDKVEIYPASPLGNHKIQIHIDYMIGYLYNVNSAFGLMLGDKIDELMDTFR